MGLAPKRTRCGRFALRTACNGFRGRRTVLAPPWSDRGFVGHGRSSTGTSSPCPGSRRRLQPVAGAAVAQGAGRPEGVVMTRRLLALSAIAIVWWLGMALPASAHPLGNFSVNVYNGIVVARDEVRIDHVIDVAEIPTVQSMPTLDANGDKNVTPTELATFARTRCGESLGGLQFSVGGAATTLAVDSSSAELIAGQAGLSTTRIECSISGPLTIAGDSDVSFKDDSAAGDVGWREVTVQGDSVTITNADVPTTSPSAQLTSYPASQVDSPLRVDSASAAVTPGGAALAASEVSDAPTSGSSPWQWGANLLGRVSSTASGPF